MPRRQTLFQRRPVSNEQTRKLGLVAKLREQQKQLDRLLRAPRQ